MTPIKHIPREPDNQMLNRGADLYREITHKLATTRSIQQIVKELFKIMHDTAPDIETEVEKRAKAFLKNGCYDDYDNDELREKDACGIIRALLRERGKI
jgi:hypothetical protein